MTRTQLRLRIRLPSDGNAIFQRKQAQSGRDVLSNDPWAAGVGVLLPLVGVIALAIRMGRQLKDALREIRREIINAGGFDSWERKHFGEAATR